ncbi:ABC transporter ATP-binding protein [Lactococcus cremoris]|uniref:ABC transporter ATP-binding protein n=1 Tax=Lactococcus lactis subsp. cremoris TaxID=1359 RepID=UPI0037BF2FFA
MTSPITVKGMSVKFGDKIILDRLSYDFESGKIICLIGPSGSGKSTFIKSIVGMQKLDSGSVEILEVKIPDRKILGQLGYMAQEDALFKELTGKQNLEFFGSLQGIKKNELTEKLEKAALTVNLTSNLKQSVANYSGGMQRRLSLAIALQTDAPILLLDEPTVGIDPELRQEIWEELRNQADQGKTILITTHVMDEAERCDIVLMLRNGKFIDEGSPKEIKEKYQVDSVEEAFIVAGKTLEMKAKEVVR